MLFLEHTDFVFYVAVTECVLALINRTRVLQYEYLRACLKLEITYGCVRT
jgi:hypothetical protein